MTVALRARNCERAGDEVARKAASPARAVTMPFGTAREMAWHPAGVGSSAGMLALPSGARGAVGLAGLRLARTRQMQRTLGNRAVQRQVQGSFGSDVAVDRDISLSDVIPDAILRPVKSLVGDASDFVSGVTKKSDTAVGGTRSDAEAATTTVDAGVNARISDAQTQGEAAASQADVQATTTEVAGKANQAAGETQAKQINNALPAAEYASDPIKPAVAPPPSGTLPGVGAPAAAAAPSQPWNCDEAWIVSHVSAAGAKVMAGLTKVVKAVVPEEVLQFAQGGIAKVQSVFNGIKQKVESAKKAVEQWVDAKLKPIRDMAAKAQQYVSDKIDAARKAVSEKVAQLGQWASAKWTSLKAGVTQAVENAVNWAKRGVSGLVDRAKDIAGRFWSMLPDAIKGPLTGAATAIAAPVVAAYKAAETAASYIQEKASWVQTKLVAAADKATKWLAEKYQKARARVVKAVEGLSKAADWVRKKAGDAGRYVYDGIDKLSGGRLSKWRAAAAARFDQLKGKVCAVTGEVAGPCVERFLPEPTGANGKSFANLITKADITVPIEGVPVKIAAGAKVTIERTSSTYNLILSGDGFAGVAAKLGAAPAAAPGGGGGGGSGTVTVDGTLPNKALALLSLSGQGPGMPGLPIPIGGKPAAAPATVAPGTPAPGAAAPAVAAPGAAAPGPAAAGTVPGAATPAPAGGGNASVEAGVKVNVALTYTFKAGGDKTTCDGLGGLTALLASQGAASLLPEPFSGLAAAGGQAAFADKLTSAKVTVAETGKVSGDIGLGTGAKGSGSIEVQRGASLESKTLNDPAKSKVLTATLFQGVTGEAAASFAPGGIGLSKIGGSLGARQELAISYNITLDAVSAGFKQALNGSVTLGGFAGVIGGLPEPLRGALQRRMACVPDANEATVAFELSQNIANLQTLAVALDKELDKGTAASAAGVWDAVSDFLNNKDNSYIEFGATMTLTEKVLGVKASGSAGEVGGGVEVTINRGTQIVLCPPTRVQPGGAGVAAAASVPGKDAICDDEELIRRFGNKRRNLGLNPDTDPKTEPRVDDAPIFDTFRTYYNRLDSWNFYIHANHPELSGEFDTKFQIAQKRGEWIQELKDRAEEYKQKFRDLTNTDPEAARREYEAHVLGDIQKKIDDYNREIAAWYIAKTGSTELIEQVIEDVHGQGTELWRAAWRAAILQVNGVLAELWPPAKGKLQAWVNDQRARLPYLDLTGPIEELDYTGSLATGFKSPPKQQIRFDPDKYDVDANLVAPPLAKYAIAIDHLPPKHQRIIGRNTSIEPLKQFADQAHQQLSARAKGYDPSNDDPFDVHIVDVPDLPEQERVRAATNRLYELRASLAPATYSRMVDELKTGGYLDPTGTKVREDLSEAQFAEMKAIMDRYSGS